MTCPRCHGRRWVCEQHPRRPWTLRHQRHAPGDACPRCNPAGAVDWAHTYAAATNPKETTMATTRTTNVKTRAQRKGLTLDEIGAFVQAAMRAGATGREMPKPRLKWGGGLVELQLDVAERYEQDGAA